MLNGFQRLWRIPFRHALWICLPLQIVMIWVAHRGWVQYRRNLDYRYDVEVSPPFDLEQWRYFTQMELARSIHRTLAPDLAGDVLETVELDIDGGHLGSLNSDLPESGRSTHYPAVVTVDGQPHRAKVRYMGDNHWHWLYPQKSWRINCRRVDPIRDRDKFNLKNPPTTAALEDVIANELAAEIGLISPTVSPVKLFVNGAYAGLHLWWDIADESLLRRFRRMPGSIYSGDGAPTDADGVRDVFVKERYWTKEAARNQQQAEDRSDIVALIHAVNEFDDVAFHDFAERTIDIGQYARFTALDRLFGGRHHDYSHNHKLYFDPYKGRFEPIEWDYAFWMQHFRFPGIDAALNPLLLRVRAHPGYELRIQRELFDLVNRVSSEWLSDRVDRGVAQIRAALAADGFRDTRDHNASNALRLATLHSAFFDDDQFDNEIRVMKRGYRNRRRWLRERLADSNLTARVSLPADGIAELELRSSGLVGQRVREVAVTTAATSVEIVRDRNRNAVVDPGEPVIARADTTDGIARLQLDEMLLPGLKKVEARSFSPLRGHVELVPAALDYSLLLRPASGGIESVRLTAANAVTGDDVPVAIVDRLPALEPCFSLHPWELPPPPEPITFEVGPGEAEIPASVTLGPSVTVVIHPGTTMRLGPGVSVEFQGKVLAEGTAAAPIRIEPLVEGEPWGVFALHGQGTTGSRFTHCEWRDGSTAKLGMVLRTGMVSIVDTGDIVMQRCFIGRNFLGDDALHWGYVAGGEIRDCEFQGALSDAFDMDISEGVRVVGCRFQNSGNDSLDLMTSVVEVVGCRFENAGDKGISVGEGTRLTLTESRFDGCLIGVEIKDSSTATIDDATRIDNCETGVNLYRKNTRYTSGGTLIADHLWVTGSKKPLTADKRSTVAVGELHTASSQD